MVQATSLVVVVFVLAYLLPQSQKYSLQHSLRSCGTYVNESTWKIVAISDLPYVMCGDDGDVFGLLGSVDVA